MKDVEMVARPALWRMVRSVLNPTRLRMMRLLFRTGDRLCVRDIARAFGIDDPIASIYLRQMNAQGLLAVERQEIRVFYRPDRDSERPEVRMFLDVLEACLPEVGSEGWEVGLMTVLRAFSHFNRLAALLRLTRGPAKIGDLKRAMGTCVKTVEHHLEFLYAADLVDAARYEAESVVVLREPTHPLAQVLLELLRKGATEGIDYQNAVAPHAVDAASRAVIRRIAGCEGTAGGAWMRRSRMKPVPGRMSADVKSALAEADRR